QKTAYEISRDWSSDVCSSDLNNKWCHQRDEPFDEQKKSGNGTEDNGKSQQHLCLRLCQVVKPPNLFFGIVLHFGTNLNSIGNRRSEERRVGKECRSRVSTYHY